MSKIDFFASKIRVEKFKGKGNFSLWQKMMKALLVQHALHKLLQEKSAKHVGMWDAGWEELDPKAVSIIQLCLADEVMYNMMDEKISRFVVKLENIAYDKESLQQAVKNNYMDYTWKKGQRYWSIWTSSTKSSAVTSCCEDRRGGQGVNTSLFASGVIRSYRKHNILRNWRRSWQLCYQTRS